MDHATLDIDNPKHAHKAERLRDDLIIWFTSVRPDGRPQTVPVWFLWDGAGFLVASIPGQKVRNIQHNPAVVLALDDTKTGEDVVILEGRAELLDDPTLGMTNPPYVAKYEGLMTAMGYSPEQIATVYNQIIRVTPMRFR